MNEYINNGYNATQAYLKVNPHLKYKTANVQACYLLANSSFKKAVELCINGQGGLITRKEDVTKDMIRIQGKAEDKGQLNVALNAIVERAKLHKLYDSDDSDAKKYDSFLKAVQINVNIDNKREEPILINPKDIGISTTYDVRADDIQSAVLSQVHKESGSEGSKEDAS